MNNQNNQTLHYYNRNAHQFAMSTASVEFSEMQNRFTDKLNSGATILDFGCGSGRDTKSFLSHGFQIEAIDGSEELCKIASEFTEIPVHQILFQDLSEVDKYDGIWACSSILHLSKDELVDVLKKMQIALKEGGVVYTSFKHGTFEGERNGRYFTDMTEESFAELLTEVDGLEVAEQWVTSDVRPGRGEEKWLNLILRKQ